MGYTLSMYYGTKGKKSKWKKTHRQNISEHTVEQNKLRRHNRRKTYNEIMKPFSNEGITIWKPDNKEHAENLLRAFLKQKKYSQKTINAMVMDGQLLDKRMIELGKEIAKEK